MPKIVYISHPIRGDVNENMQRVWDIIRSVRSPDIRPIAPYLGFASLNPENPRERWLGMLFREMLFRFKAFDELWVYGDHISDGMVEDIALADACGIHFEVKTEAAVKAFAKYEHLRASEHR